MSLYEEPLKFARQNLRNLIENERHYSGLADSLMNHET
jgi:hypothetical protein